MGIKGDKRKMIEQELYNEYRKSDCKSFTDFLINKITELKKTYRKQRNKRIDELQKENKELNKKLFQAETDYDKLHWERNDILAERNKAMKHLKDLVYVVELGKNELATARILAEAEQFLRDSEVDK